MCCLCQPELVGGEPAAFEADPRLAEGLTDVHIDGRKAEGRNTIKLQGGCGACWYLKDRRCTAYGMRPRFCRQFPRALPCHGGGCRLTPTCRAAV